MTDPLRVLYIDDRQTDRELVNIALKNATPAIDLIEISKRDQFDPQFKKGEFDIVLSDFNILGFDGLQIIDVIHDKYPGLPVVIITGTGSEEVAVEAFKRGAVDYVLKTPLQLLKLSTTLALTLENKTPGREQVLSSLLRHKRLADAEKNEQSLPSMLNQLSQSVLNIERAKQDWESSIDIVADPIFLHDDKGRILRANRAYAEKSNMAIKEILGKFYWEVFPKHDGPLSSCSLGKTTKAMQEEIIFYNDQIYLTHSYAIRSSEGEYLYSTHFMQDITKQKKQEKRLRESEEKFRIMIDENPYGIMVIDHKGDIIFVNPAAEILYDNTSERLIGLPLGYPLTHKGMSELDLAHKDGTISQVEMRVVTVKRGQAKESIAIFRDITNQRQAEEKLRLSLEGTIKVICLAVEARDPYTAGHQQRVAQLAVAIAGELGLDEHTIEGIHMGAIIHDIGKIQLPAEILSKPTKLTDLEYQMVQSHSKVGFDILKDVAFPWPVANIAYQHHERMDGSGYPQGLKGKDICLEAKIVAVADMTEAIASHRPYRASLGVDFALKIISSERGEKLDADVVDACLKLFKENRFDW